MQPRNGLGNEQAAALKLTGVELSLSIANF